MSLSFVLQKMCHYTSRLAVFFCLLNLAPLWSDEGSEGKVIIESPWIRSVLPVQKTTALYLSIENQSDETLTLIDIETPIAKRDMFHETIEKNGIASMRHRDFLDILPGEKLELSPGGLHIMLMGLVHPITEGNTVPVVLHFRDSLSKTVEATIIQNR
ncbi:copper chaperone PCu(A)C [Pleionea sediminis]|uniref:copper chaperone PCu(A)C n=1 Tax=Pleionea sediminis TaxID=2569479 RepID=UPI0011871AB3|nr:copper chaperone PCu(A)C [Pleionea sediminis]